MKRSLLFIIFVCLPVMLWAQIDTTSFRISGSDVSIKEGAYIYIKGNILNRINPYSGDISNKGQINDMGKIYLNGHVNNMIGNNLFLSTTTGELVLFGDYIQSFYGDSIYLNILTLDKTNNGLFLNQDLRVHRQLNFTSGYLDIQGYIVNLGDSGVVYSEREGNSIRGTQGKVIAVNPSLQPGKGGNLGGLGLTLTPSSDNLGLTTIERRFSSQENVTDGSISRYFNIYPSNDGKTDIRFSYFDSEQESVGGETKEGTFKLWKSPDVNSEQAGSYERQVSVATGEENYVSANNVELSNEGQRLTVAKDNCDNPPVVDFTSDPIKLCKGDSVLLEAGNEDDYIFWERDSSTVSQFWVHEKDILSGNIDTFRVTVTDTLGCYVVAEQPVQLQPNPKPDFYVASSYCSGTEVTFDNRSAIDNDDYLSYEWIMPDSSVSTEEDPSFLFDSYGTYNISLNVTSAAGCKADTSKTVLINANPTADFEADVYDQCQGEIITLTNKSSISGAAIARSNWYFGDGYTSELSGSNALNEELKSYSSSGSFEVTLRVLSNGNCSDSLTQDVRILPTPTASFSAVGFLKDAGTQFANLSSIEGNSSMKYSWDFGDGSEFSSESDPLHVYDQLGYKNVTLTATSPDYCYDNATQQIFISGNIDIDFSTSASEICLGDSILMTNLSTVEGDDSLSYDWQFGSDLVSTKAQPSVLYTEPGTYTIRLTATSKSGTSESTTKRVIVHPLPEAKFSVANVCDNSSISINNYSEISSGTMSYSWDLGDSTFSTTESPSHTYDKPGDYNIKLITTSEKSCTDTLENTVSVYDMPVADFTADNICYGNQTFFENQSSIDNGTIAYKWDFNDNQVSVDENPVHTYTSFGSYNVTLTAVSDNTCENSVTKTVEVYEKPQALFSADDICLGTETPIRNNSFINSGTLNYTWDFGEGSTSTLQTPQYIYSSANSYNIELIATSDNNCSDTTQQLVDVYPEPVADFSASNVCLGNTTLFTNLSSIDFTGAELSYQWNFGNGITSTEENPIITFSNAGTFTVTLTTSTSSGCSNTVRKNVIVYANPDANFTVYDTCAYDQVRIINTSDNSENVNYTWSVDNGTSFVGNEPVFSIAAAGEHLITLKAESSNGCSVSYANIATIHPLPEASFTAEDESCVNEPILVRDFSTISSGSLSYKWDFNGIVNSRAEINSYTFDSFGEKEIILTLSSEFGCTDADTVTVMVNEQPVVDFSVDNLTPELPTAFTPDVQFSGDDNLAYLWEFGDGSSSTERTPVHTYQNPGTYYVSLEVTPENSCAAQITKELEIADVPTAQFSVSGNACENNQVTFTNTSLVSPLHQVTYNWDFGDGTTSNEESPLKSYSSAGNYEVSLIVSYYKGLSDTVSQSISIEAYPQALFTVSDVCQNENLVVSNASEALSTASYQWDFGDGSYSETETVEKSYSLAGTYTISLTLTTPNGCIDTISNKVTVNPVYKPGFTIPQTVCLGEEITATAGNKYSADISNYQWDFNDGSTAEGIQVSHIYSAPGQYEISLTTTGVNACPVTESKIITVYDGVDAMVRDTTVCLGESITLTNEIGNNNDTEYSWSFGDGTKGTGAAVEKLYNTAGTYMVIVDANLGGCSARDTAHVTVHAPVVLNLGDTISTCGSSMEVNPAVSAVSYSWMPDNSTAPTLTVNTNQMVYLSVEDEYGCTASDSVFVQLNNAVKVNLGEDRVMCEGTELDAGNPGADYLWQDGSTQRSIKVIESGKYDVIVTDANGCTAENSVTISVNTLPDFYLGEDITQCYNSSFMLDPGITAASYLWSTGDTIQAIVPEQSGTYWLRAVLLTGCTVNDTVNVDILPVPRVNLGSDTTVCSNDILLSLNPGKFSSYSWSTGADTDHIIITEAGDYSVTVTNSSGCSASDNILVTAKPLPTITLDSETEACDGEILMLEAGDVSNSYSWSEGSGQNTLAVEKNGLYSVTATNSDGCEAVASTQVNFKTAPFPDLGDDTNICASEIPVVLYSGTQADTYLWNTGENTDSIVISQSGIYSVEAANNNGCQNTDSVIIDIVDVPVISIADTIHACEGDTVVVDAGNPGADYVWSDQSSGQTLSITQSGNFWLQVSYAQGCEVLKEFTVLFHESPALSLGSDLEICKAQTPVRFSSNVEAVSYEWNTGETTSFIDVINSGTYSLNVTSQYGCMSSDSVVLTVNNPESFDLGDTLTFCSGETLTLRPDVSGVSYLWSNGVTTDSQQFVNSGDVWLQVTDSNGCNYTDSVLLVKNPAPLVNLGDDKTYCDNEDIVLNAGYVEGSTYLWNNGSNQSSLHVDTTGTYSVLVENTYGCQTSEEINITVNPSPEKVFSESLEACGQMVLNAQNQGSDYLWSTNATDRKITVEKSGTYLVTITNAYNCSIRDTAKVTINQVPEVNLGSDQETCQGETIVLDAQNQGNTYVWSTGATSRQVSVSTTGDYWVQVQNSEQCVNTDTILVTVHPSPEFSIGTDKNVCEGTAVTLSPDVTCDNYLWSTGATTKNITVDEPGEYRLQSTNEFGCIYTDTIMVYYHPYPIVNLGNDTTVCGHITLFAENSGYQYLWNTGSSDSAITVSESEFYSVNVFDEYGCEDTDTIKITVKPEPTLVIDGDTSICEGEITALVIHSNGDEYYWENNNSSDTTWVSQSGDFKAVATNSIGCIVEKTVKVEVNPNPVIELGPDQKICGETSVDLDAGNTGSSYYWNSDNGFLSTKQQVTLTEGGKYWVDITNQYNCTSSDTINIDNISINITAQSLFASKVNTGDTVQFLNLSYPQPFTQVWDFGDGIYDTILHPIHIYLIEDNFPVTLTVDNGVCSSTMTKYIQTSSLKAESQAIVDSLKQQNKSLIKSAIAYPNPVDDYFIVEAELAVASDLYVDVIRIDGLRVKLNRYSNQQLFHQVYNVSSWSPGMYIIRIIARNEKYIVKIIKK